MKGAGVGAVMTELTRELILPVMEAEAAADWTAIARAGMIEVGILAFISCSAAEDRAVGFVLDMGDQLETGRNRLG